MLCSEFFFLFWCPPSLVPRLISQAFIACSMKSDKSLGDKPGNEASALPVNGKLTNLIYGEILHMSSLACSKAPQNLDLFIRLVIED